MKKVLIILIAISNVTVSARTFHKEKLIFKLTHNTPYSVKNIGKETGHVTYSNDDQYCKLEFRGSTIGCTRYWQYLVLNKEQIKEVFKLLGVDLIRVGLIIPNDLRLELLEESLGYTIYTTSKILQFHTNSNEESYHLHFISRKPKAIR